MEFPGGVAVPLKLALSVTPRPARSDFDRDFVLHSWGPRCATSRMAEAACAHPVLLRVMADWFEGFTEAAFPEGRCRPPLPLCHGANAIRAPDD